MTDDLFDRLLPAQRPKMSDKEIAFAVQSDLQGYMNASIANVRATANYDAIGESEKALMTLIQDLVQLLKREEDGDLIKAIAKIKEYSWRSDPVISGWAKQCLEDMQLSQIGPRS